MKRKKKIAKNCKNYYDVRSSACQKALMLVIIVNIYCFLQIVFYSVIITPIVDLWMVGCTKLTKIFFFFAVKQWTFLIGSLHWNGYIISIQAGPAEEIQLKLIECRLQLYLNEYMCNVSIISKVVLLLFVCLLHISCIDFVAN